MKKNNKLLFLIIFIIVVILITMVLYFNYQPKDNNSNNTNNSNQPTIVSTNMSGLYQKDGVSLYLYQKYDYLYYSLVNGNLHGYAKVVQNSAYTEIDGKYYRFTLDNQNMKVETNDSLLSNGVYSKIGDADDEVYYKNNNSSISYYDSSYNGGYGNSTNNHAIYVYKSANDKLSLVVVDENNEKKLNLTFDLIDGDEFTLIDGANKYNVVFGREALEFKDISNKNSIYNGNYTRFKDMIYDDIINDFKNK